MIAKEKIEKIVRNLNCLLEKPTIEERTANDKNSEDFKDHKGYVWDEVYNAVGGTLAAELSCKLLACLISDMIHGNYSITCVESLRNSLQKMSTILDKEMEVRKVEFDVEESVADMDFECF